MDLRRLLSVKSDTTGEANERFHVKPANAIGEIRSPTEATSEGTEVVSTTFDSYLSTVMLQYHLLSGLIKTLSVVCLSCFHSNDDRRKLDKVIYQYIYRLGLASIYILLDWSGDRFTSLTISMSGLTFSS